MRKAAILWLAGWALFSLPIADFRARPKYRHVILEPFKKFRPGDALRNVVYYVPAGIIGLELGLAPLPTVAAAAGLSLAAEASQLFATDRFPSSSDVILNTAGAALGVAWWSERRRRGAGHSPRRIS